MLVVTYSKNRSGRENDNEINNNFTCLKIWRDTCPSPKFNALQTSKEQIKSQHLPYDIIVPEDASGLKWWQGKLIHLYKGDQ
jgi:hypothetical protein